MMLCVCVWPVRMRYPLPSKLISVLKSPSYHIYIYIQYACGHMFWMMKRNWLSIYKLQRINENSMWLWIYVMARAFKILIKIVASVHAHINEQIKLYICLNLLAQDLPQSHKLLLLLLHSILLYFEWCIQLHI